MAIDLNKILEKLAQTVDEDIKQTFKDAAQVRLRWPKVQIRTDQGSILHTNEQGWPPKQILKAAPYSSFTPPSKGIFRTKSKP